MQQDPAARPKRSLNRRELIRLTGATATAALVGTARGRAPAPAAGIASHERPGQIVRVDARPEPISIDIASTALIVIDMTNDFGSRGGMFDRAGIDIAPIQRVVVPTARVLVAARRAGIRVIYLSMAYRPDLSDVGPAQSPNWRVHKQFLQVGSNVQAPDGAPTRILIRDTWGTRVVSELQPQPGEPVIYKTRYSGFYETDLDDKLKALAARYLVIAGCTTSVCVESTLRDAMFRDYSPILLSDCSAEPIGYQLPRSNHEASLLVIETLLGWVSGSERFIAALETPVSPA